MKQLGILGLVLVAVLAKAQGVYQWKDSDGVVHFSDKPHSGAKTLKLPPVQTYSPPSPDKKTPKTASIKEKKAPVVYSEVTITSPAPEATIRNNQGKVNVSALIQPKLGEGDKVQLMLDGKPLGEPQANTSFTLNDVYRGSHSVSIAIVRDGQTIESSPSVTFFVHRAFRRGK